MTKILNLAYLVTMHFYSSNRQLHGKQIGDNMLIMEIIEGGFEQNGMMKNDIMKD